MRLRIRALGEREDAALRSVQLDRVAGEVAELLGAQLDQLASRLDEPLGDLGPTLGVRHHIEPDEREVGADAHHDVGVIDRDPVELGVEHHRLVAEGGAESLQHDRVGAVRPHRVGDAVEAVEHHRPGALEVEPVDLEARVVDDLLHPVLLLEQLEHVAAPLEPAARA